MSLFPTNNDRLEGAQMSIKMLRAQVAALESELRRLREVEQRAWTLVRGSWQNPACNPYTVPRDYMDALRSALEARDGEKSR